MVATTKSCSRLTGIVFFAALFHLGYTAQAQITLEYEYFQSLLANDFSITSYEGDDDAAIDALMDAKQGGTFDLRGIVIDRSYSTHTQSVVLPAGIPGEDEEAFSDATHAWITEADEEEDATIYVFYRLDPDAVQLLGMYSITIDEGEEIIGIITYDPVESIQPIPTTVSSSWQTETTETVHVNGSPVFTSSLDIDYEVIGYGTLLTDFGSSEVLQILRTERRSLTGVGEFVTQDYELISGDSLSARVVVDDGNPGQVEIDVRHGFTGTSIEDLLAHVEGFNVGGNFPNPFSGSTTITYELPETRHVSVTVFDLLGRKVTTLVDDVVSAGTHSVVFDAGRRSPGVYLYRVSAGEASGSGRMVLTR